MQGVVQGLRAVTFGVWLSTQLQDARQKEKLAQGLPCFVYRFITICNSHCRKHLEQVDEDVRCVDSSYLLEFLHAILSWAVYLLQCCGLAGPQLPGKRC